jgi:hypothetical protein
MTDYLYAIDPETEVARRFYRDGAAFVATAQPHPLAFWTIHPDVDRIADTSNDDGTMTVRVWLKPPLGTVLGSIGLQRPGRPADYFFYGGGLMGNAFWEGHPSIEFFEIANHLGDNHDQDGWNVRVWLRGS